MYKFELGDEVKDIVTGFRGIVRARSEYDTGCNRYGVQSQKLENGKPADWQWFDEPALTLSKSNKIVIGPKGPLQKTRPGGPRTKNQTPPSF
jgi:hypothetical protein